MQTLIAIQDKLVATLVKCCEMVPGHDGLCIGHRKGGAFRAAMNKAQRSFEEMGFSREQAYRITRDACDMAKLLMECE